MAAEEALVQLSPACAALTTAWRFGRICCFARTGGLVVAERMMALADTLCVGAKREDAKVMLGPIARAKPTSVKLI